MWGEEGELGWWVDEKEVGGGCGGDGSFVLGVLFVIMEGGGKEFVEVGIVDVDEIEGGGDGGVSVWDEEENWIEIIERF